MKTTFISFARLFQTDAFPTDDEANSFMLQNEGTGLIGVDVNGLRHVARLSDKGQELPPISALICCCCGGRIIGRQWSNQDTGFGLGDCCVEYVKPRLDDDMTKVYGHSGYHFNLATGASA